MAENRIYVVTDSDLSADDRSRLVRASNPSQAIKHVASRFKVRVASQDDLANLCGAGIKVEKAGEEA